MTGDQDPVREEPMPETSVGESQSLVDPVAVGPGDAGPAADGGADGASAAPVPVPILSGADASLLGLVDRLTGVLERTELGELEVAAGGTTIVLRAPSAVERPAPAVAAAAAEVAPLPTGPAPERASETGRASTPPSVKAPLTGIYYAAPSPGATPYVAVGDHVAVGQIIGLIEAMKLFNEIKSDLAGRIVRVCADSGALVKAKQPLIEVEPA
jgi:acetyl-CoA carboxylase biotin carboxyl carrier protein